jgi:hypothetical protein
LTGFVRTLKTGRNFLQADEGGTLVSAEKVVANELFHAM